ncbi:hemerythrin domain-containing protein [Streptomyces sp. H10-C2]|nr:MULTISPECIES: hemerythrin domain-containing protein [unclassified Streptomyces]MDJ0347042.1 hemerythrin domain-containing protein [Streptomyces sp. PH10-H1]MDJ0375310.1 hemerythrin domain-containing protein [Streptomyces sp. H10-C2]
MQALSDAAPGRWRGGADACPLPGRATEGDAERRKVVDRFTIELVRHSVAEGQHLYPAVRERVPGGGEMADKELADHAKVEELLAALSHLAADDPQFDVVVNELIAEVSAHVADEENRVFPALAQVCSPDILNVLGDQIRSAKKSALTRPRATAPDTPPEFDLLLVPSASLVKRVREFFSTGREPS